MTRRQPPALVVLLIASFLANIGLAVWAVRSARDANLALLAVSAPPLQPAVTPVPSTEAPLPSNLTAYAALGTYLAENNHIPALKWTEAQFGAFQRGVRASYEGRGYIVDEEAVKLRDAISAKVQSMIETKQPDPIEEYFRTLRDKEGVQKTASGLHYRITQEGYGKHPGPESTVVVSYGARLPEGKSIPSLTRARAKSAVRDLLPGLGEGVQFLTPGGKALVYLAPALSFGNGAWPAEVPKGAPIVFFLELHEVTP